VEYPCIDSFMLNSVVPQVKVSLGGLVKPKTS
jgi:hypothetical protein